MTAQTTPREFQHQLRSLFAVLRTLVRHTSEGRISVEEYAAHLEGRIGALARVHEILMRAPGEGADLYELVYGEFISQAIPETSFHASGPEVRIAPKSATALTLAFHELTVNALTHGALSTATGRAEVTWNIQAPSGESWLHLDWKEFGAGPPRDSPGTGGFGNELIERMLPYELSARTTLSATREGIYVQLQIPAIAGNIIWRHTAA
jgi:two-component sensor histidine kinase